MGHFDGGQCGVFTFIPVISSGPVHGLFERVRGDQPKADGDANFERDFGQPARGFTGDVQMVRRLTANNTTQTDKGVVFMSIRESLRGKRKLPGAGYPCLEEIGRIRTIAQQRLASAGNQSSDDLFVESARDQRDTETLGT